MTVDPVPELPPGSFAKRDAGEDLAFYALPRFVAHIDDRAIAALTDRYRSLMPDGSHVLDLMSSWVSHLPPERDYAEVVGHGMNAEELAANPRLDRWFVQDLNRTPALPLKDDTFDAALCCVGVQYLQQPVTVFGEVRRTLAVGRPFFITFSNRCFPTKAVAVWRGLDHRGHAALVSQYLQNAGFRDINVEILADGRAGDPLIAVTGLA